MDRNYFESYFVIATLLLKEHIFEYSPALMHNKLFQEWHPTDMDGTLRWFALSVATRLTHRSTKLDSSSMAVSSNTLSTSASREYNCCEERCREGRIMHSDWKWRLSSPRSQSSWITSCMALIALWRRRVCAWCKTLRWRLPGNLWPRIMVRLWLLRY